MPGQSIGNIKVGVTADASRVPKQIRSKTVKPMGRIGRSMAQKLRKPFVKGAGVTGQKAAKRFSKPLNRAAAQSGASAGKKAGGAMGAGMLGAVKKFAGPLAGVAAIKVGFEEVKEAQASAADLANTLKNTTIETGLTTKGMLGLASSIEQYSGQSHESIEAAQNQLLQFSSVQKAVKGNKSQFKDLTKITADMAAKGIDSAKAAQLLGRAYAEPAKSITRLERYGVEFNKQQQEQIKAAVEAGDKEKAQGIILDKLKGQFGGAAKAAGDTLGGSIQKLKRAFEGLMGDALKALLPALKPLIKIMQDLMVTLGPVIEQIGKQLAPIFAMLGDIVLQVWDALKPLIPLGMQLLNLAFELVKPLLQLVGPILKPLIQLFMTLLQPILDLIQPLISGLVPVLQFLGDILKNVIMFEVGLVKGAFKLLGAVAMWLWQNAIQPAFEAIGAVATWLWQNAIQPAFDAIGAVFHWLWENAVQPVIDFITGYIQDVLAPVFGWVYQNVIQPAFDGIKGAFDFVADTVSNVINGIVSTFRNVLAPVFDWIYHTIIKPVFDGIASTFNWIVDRISDAIGTISDVIGGIGDTFHKVFSGIGDFVGSVFDGISNGIKNAINGVIGVVNGAIGGVNSITSKVGIPSIPKIPRLATGGVLDRGGLAVVGERGPELVNLPTGAQVFPNDVSRGMVSNSQSTVNRNVEAGAIQIVGRDPYRTAHEVADKIADGVLT